MIDCGYMADIVMEAPHAFSIGDVSYQLYPMTIGKMLLMQQILESIGIDGDGISKNPILEIVKTVALHRADCLSLIVLAIAKTKDECFDPERIKSKTMELSAILSNEDVATLMVHVMTCDKSDEVMRQYGIDKEQEAMMAVGKAKSQGCSLSFGGKTILGTYIDQACERYGWTLEYCVWGVSYSALRIMLADKVNTIYVSEEERKNIPSHILQKDEDAIRANKENMETIKSMSWK